MRTMEIPPFPRKFETDNLQNLFKSRLTQKLVLWPHQAIALAGYMARPNDPIAREELQGILKGWAEGSLKIPDRIRRIQHEWLRVADVFHLWLDLIDGNHQKNRGGPSISKAITLTEANAKSRGTGAANLWYLWGQYQDVAHLVTAAVLICAEVRRRLHDWEPSEFGLGSDQFGPFQMVLMMPDLVLAVALEFERRGLSHIPSGGTEPTLNTETLWRIPADINVVPIVPPTRKIRTEDILVLNARRAGNRGVANRRALAASPPLADVLAQSTSSASKERAASTG